MKLNIPVVGVLDSNSSPDGISFPVPGNDDAARSLGLFAELFSGSVLKGLQVEMMGSGVDLGAAISHPDEPALQEIVDGVDSGVELSKTS